METEHLHLRPFTTGDAAAIHRVYSDPEVMRYVAGGPVADLAGTDAMLREYGDHQEGHGFSFWAVIERAGGEVIAVAEPRNPASIRVLEKIGMRPVGRRMVYGHEQLLYRQVVASRDRG
jgi:RimJ/RimL family protein N-acetyltransferase